MLDLSCRRRGEAYYVVTDRWQKFSDMEVNENTLCSLASSCSEFLVHGVDVEGMKLGIDAELVSILGTHSPIPVTYAGGATTLVRTPCSGKAARQFLLLCIRLIATFSRELLHGLTCVHTAPGHFFFACCHSSQDSHGEAAPIDHTPPCRQTWNESKQLGMAKLTSQWGALWIYSAVNCPIKQ